MEYNKSNIDQLYLSGDYVRKNPTLHTEDSAWKANVLRPFLDVFLQGHGISTVKVLDVGGGAGLLLQMVSHYLTDACGRRVIKCALEYSPEILEVQKSNNPDLAMAQLGSIEVTPFSEKEFDLVLLIDVLEHLPDDRKAVKEIGRICRYAIIKIPLEDTVQFRIMNRLRKGSLRRHAIESVGHVNSYSVANYRRIIESGGGTILFERFANIYEYFLTSPVHRSRMPRRQLCKDWICSKLNRFAPRLTARLVRDHVITLVYFPA